MGERGVGFKVLWPLTLATLVVGCASHPGKTSDADLTHLDQWLPGHYDNRAQVADDRRAGHVPHDARTLLIATVNSMMVGTHVFYLEERTADSERRILQQHIISSRVCSRGISSRFAAASSLGRRTAPGSWVRTIGSAAAPARPMAAPCSSRPGSS
jgi:hypothetical protein